MRLKRIKGIISLTVLIWVGGLLATERPPFSPEKLSFSIKFKDEISDYKVLGVYVLPMENLELAVSDSAADRQYVVTANAGALTTVSSRKWRWTAPPSHGLFPLTIAREGSDEVMTLNIFVMIPASEVKDDMLNGYRIGKYPATPLRGLNIYKPPRGFVELTSDVADTLVSPHFKLGAFVCKQASKGYPKYLVLRERLLLKLELVLARVNEKGIRCDTFAMLSGFRTPYYNKLIGNVKYSRHTWGGAADIFVDENPRNGIMDDLNGDGKIDFNDAHVLYDLVDDMYGKSWYAPFKGGLGLYRKTASHGPFIHVDVRGFRARWGD